MKKIDELNAGKAPIVIIDKSLDKLDEVVLFPEKVEKANETIAKIGLPKKSNTVVKKSIANIGTEQPVPMQHLDWSTAAAEPRQRLFNYPIICNTYTWLKN